MLFSPFFFFAIFLRFSSIFFKFFSFSVFHQMEEKIVGQWVKRLLKFVCLFRFGSVRLGFVSYFSVFIWLHFIFLDKREPDLFKLWGDGGIRPISAWFGGGGSRGTGHYFGSVRLGFVKNIWDEGEPDLFWLWGDQSYFSLVRGGGVQGPDLFRFGTIRIRLTFLG